MSADPKVERVSHAALALANNLNEFGTAEYACERIDELDTALDALIPERVDSTWSQAFMATPAQLIVGLDVGSEDRTAAYMFKWDNLAGQYVPIGPVDSEKRRRWQEMRDRIDAAIASGRNPWRE